MPPTPAALLWVLFVGSSFAGGLREKLVISKLEETTALRLEDPHGSERRASGTTMHFNSLGKVYKIGNEVDAEETNAVVEEMEVAKVIEVGRPPGRQGPRGSLEDALDLKSIEALLDSGKCKVTGNETKTKDIKEILGKSWKKTTEKELRNEWKSESPEVVGRNLILTYVNDKLTFEEFVSSDNETRREESREPDPKEGKFELECHTEDVLDPQVPEDRKVLEHLLEAMPHAAVAHLGAVEKTVVSKKRTVVVEMNDVEGDSLNGSEQATQ